MMNTVVTVREFVEGDAEHFKRLNEEWIAKYFRIEMQDAEVLGDPQMWILSKGGRIFFAEKDGEVVGCCALMPRDEGMIELTKMAVTERARGGGVGRKLLFAVVEEARREGLKKLYLETNHTLENAIHLYEAVGFRHLPAERARDSHYDRADVFMEMEL